jgi:hypothetical protein
MFVLFMLKTKVNSKMLDQSDNVLQALVHLGVSRSLFMALEIKLRQIQEIQYRPIINLESHLAQNLWEKWTTECMTGKLPNLSHWEVNNCISKYVDLEAFRCDSLYATWYEGIVYLIPNLGRKWLLSTIGYSAKGRYLAIQCIAAFTDFAIA